MNVKWYMFWKQFGKEELSCDSIIFTPRFQDNWNAYLHRNLHTQNQVKIFSSKPKSETGQMSSDKWINKLHISINTVVLKRKEVLRHAIKCMNPEHITPSERHYTTVFTNTYNRQIHRDRK